jgi:hypothetical protein
MSCRADKMVLETSGNRTMEFGRNKYDVTSRGGKGFEAVKRTTFVRVVPPPITLVDWEQIGEPEPKENGNGTHGQRTLFE